MVGKMLVLVFFVQYIRFCSVQASKVLSRQMSSFQQTNLSMVQRQSTQSRIIQQEGNLSQGSLPQTHKQIQNVSATSQHCEVDELSRVGCGEPGISPAECEALECCYDHRPYMNFDGPMCYYGNAVTVQCSMDGQVVLVISRDVTIPSINLDSIRILEATGGPCTAVDSNDDFAIYQFPVTACGAKIKVVGDYIVFENTMASLYEVGLGPHGAITRESSFEVMFQCRYLATAVGDLVVEVHTPPSLPPLVRHGSLRVELRIANGVCTTKGCSDADMYSSYYTAADYPVTKVLQDPVYVEVLISQRADPNIALVLNRCWATSSQDSSSTPQWDLLVDGCPYTDDRYLTTLIPVSPSSDLKYPNLYRRFVVKMFTFVDENFLVARLEQLFIHCSTSVCQLSNTVSCEPSCQRRRRSVSAVSDSGKNDLVSSGGVLFITDSPLPAERQADDHEVSRGTGYRWYGITALTAISVCVLLVTALRRRRKHQPHLHITRL